MASHRPSLQTVCARSALYAGWKDARSSRLSIPSTSRTEIVAPSRMELTRFPFRVSTAEENETASPS